MHIAFIQLILIFLITLVMLKDKRELQQRNEQNKQTIEECTNELQNIKMLQSLDSSQYPKLIKHPTEGTRIKRKFPTSPDQAMRVGQDVTRHHCNGESLIVDGANINLVVTGFCKHVLVKGHDGKLTFDMLQAIEIIGDGYIVFVNAIDFITIKAERSRVYYERELDLRYPIDSETTGKDSGMTRMSYLRSLRSANN